MYDLKASSFNQYFYFVRIFKQGFYKCVHTLDLGLILTIVQFHRRGLKLIPH